MAIKKFFQDKVLLFWAVLVLSSSPVFAGSDSAKASSMGVHGMLLFGSESEIFASHLPMFHAPHHYQVVLELGLSEQKLDLALRKRLAKIQSASYSAPVNETGQATYATVLTLAPERFELARLHPNAADSEHALQQFKADIYLGHFERGGTLLFEGATVQIKQVHFFAELPRQAQSKPLRRSAMLLGRSKVKFALQHILSKPDCDWLVRVELPDDARHSARPSTLRYDSAGCMPTLSSLQQALSQNLALPPTQMQIGTLYLERGDLR